RLQSRDRRLPRADAEARHAPAAGVLHGRVRDEQVVERLQLVQGQLHESDPGQHGSADLRRSRDRSRVPRRLPRAPRLQRAARTAPGEGARLDRVHGVPALHAAVAHRGRDGELRHRGRVPRQGARGVRAGDALPARGPGSRARGRVLRRAGARRRAVVRRQRGGAAVPRRRDRSRGGNGVARTVRADAARARRAARPLLRSVPKLRDQLQLRQGSGAAVHRVARRHGCASRQAVAGVRDAAVVAAAALRAAVKPYRRPLILVAALACLAGYVYAYASGRAVAPIRSDAFSYYVYLPAWAIYQDPSLQAVADDCCGGAFPGFTAIVRWRFTQRWVNAHPIGEAVMIAPFFAVAHALTLWTNLSPDRFTLYYQPAAGLAGLAYVVAGLWFVRRLLERHFSGGVADAAVA